MSQNKWAEFDDITKQAKAKEQDSMISEEELEKSDPFLEKEFEEEEGDARKEDELSFSSTAEVQAEIEGLKEALKEGNEKLLRAHAEMDNVRNRSKQEVAKAHKFALENFVKELLPVVDSLERALETHNESMAEGVELTLRLLLKVMEKEGVEQVDPLGEPFNPERHEAMSIQQNSEVDPNSVLTVLQKGYVLNGRLIRPAMVIVSKVE